MNGHERFETYLHKELERLNLMIEIFQKSARSDVTEQIVLGNLSAQRDILEDILHHFVQFVKQDFRDG